MTIGRKILMTIQSYNDSRFDAAKDIFNKAVESLQWTAEHGDIKTIFTMDKENFRPCMNTLKLARQMLRDEGLKLTYHYRSKDFSITVMPECIESFNNE